MNKVYIASRFSSNVEVVRKLTELIEALGAKCTQTWHNSTATDSEIDRSAVAFREIGEIDQADTLILYTENCERVPGGMHFEAGYAFGRGKRLIVVGPKVHIFCDLSCDWYPTLNDFISHLNQ